MKSKIIKYMSIPKTLKHACEETSRHIYWVLKKYLMDEWNFPKQFLFVFLPTVSLGDNLFVLYLPMLFNSFPFFKNLSDIFLLRTYENG